MPAKRKPLVRIHSVDDPAAFARTLLIEGLGRAKVTVEASALGTNRHLFWHCARAFLEMPQIVAA